MTKRALAAVAAAAALAACSSDPGGVDPEAIDGAELAAVQRALGDALATDSLYPTLALLVFPFVDRASHLRDPSGDTTRLVGIELDIDVQTSSGPLIAGFTTILGWTDYSAATRTVDSVFFVAGAGRAPVDDLLQESFSPDMAGTGTALVIHTAPDSTTTTWQTGTGRLLTSSSSYGAGRTQSGGGITITTSRGTLNGSVTVGTAYLRPNAATTVATTKDFSAGVRALKVMIRGSL